MALSVGFASAATASPRGTIGGNADFTGTWNPDSGISWTITHQDTSGACQGTTSAVGYALTNCQVTGSSYVFDVTCCSGYVSHNTGTISGNSLVGNFNDGSDHPYTATRTGGGQRAVTVTVTCDTPPNPAQFGSCAAVVADASAQSPLETPTGSVKLTATTGTLYGSQCTLVASASAPSSPSCSLLYQPPAGGLPAGEAVPVTASYAGDSNFSSGSGGSTLYAASLSDTDGDPLGICAGTTGDCTGYDESTAANDPASDTSLSFTSDCSGSTANAGSRTAAEIPADDPGTCTVSGTATTTPPSAEAQAAFLADQKAMNQSIQQMMSDQQKAAASQQQITQDAAKIVTEIQDSITIEKKAAADKAFQIGDTYIRGDQVFRADVATTSSKPIKTPFFLGALEAVVLDHPTSSEIKAYNATVALAATTSTATVNELARYEIGLIDYLGYHRLAVELHGKHGKLPSSITLGTVKATIKAGTQKKLSIKISTIDQRLLRVLSTLPKQSSVTLKTTLTRPHVKPRSGSVKLHVTDH